KPCPPRNPAALSDSSPRRQDAARLHDQPTTNDPPDAPDHQPHQPHLCETQLPLAADPPILLPPR
ncbi:hypothetical protein ACPTIH_31105, partial [Pseudomonas aeruginosa]